MATWPTYATESEADSYHSAHGDPSAWSGATSATKAVALRAASEYLDHTYGNRWVGTRATSTQERDWPRINAYDIDGNALSSTTTPQVVLDACAYLALRYVQNGDLNPDLDYRGDIKSERDTVGGLTTEVEYLGGKSQSKVYPKVEGMLLGKGLIASSTGAYRA